MKCSSGPQNRAFRLSMINSAQVFSPQPSKDPRENLRILQSPLKNSFKSPVKATLQEENEIILVQGNHPRVVQDERDLIILEDVALAPPPSPLKLHANLEPPRTPPPRRRSLGGNTLHRAVLIRSAQRAVLKAEKDREEEEEEMEVLGVVVGAEDRDEDEDDEREDIEMGSPTEDNEADYLDEADVADDGNSTLVSFMSPQAKLPLGNHATDVRPTVERFSLGGGEAKRVVVQQPWRVRDLVIPPITATSSSSTGSPEKVAGSPAMTAQANHFGDSMASPSRTRTPMRTPARPTLTEEERKAIQERRRSALKESGPFFLGGAPGLSPVKSKSSSSTSSNSPMKGLIIYEEDGEMKDKSEEEEDDARSLLDRMKETVDEMRRRRSVASRITTPHAEGLSPRPLFAPVTPNLRRPLFQPEVMDSKKDESNEVREQEEPFSLLRPGAREEVVSPATLKVESSEEGSIPLPIVVVDGEDSAKSRDSQEIQEQPTRAKARLLRAPKSIDVAAGPSEPNKEAVSLFRQNILLNFMS